MLQDLMPRRFDALVIKERLWLIVIESKRYGFSVRQAIAQTLAYMAGASGSQVFAIGCLDSQPVPTSSDI
jgi:hypothetical protein